MELGLATVALSILVSALIIGKDIRMALDRSGLDAALQSVADGLQEVAAAIANPPADSGEAQAVLDEAAGKLNAFASQLGDMKSAEDVEDAG